MLAVAYELKSPRMGIWTRPGWIEGWKSLRYVSTTICYDVALTITLVSFIRCDNLDSMKLALPRLRDQLSSNAEYFTKVYYHTFDFARNEGQRSLGKSVRFRSIVSASNLTLRIAAIETAKGLWSLLLSHGLKGGAISSTSSTDANGDVKMDGDVGHGWTEARTTMWFKFLEGKRLKGISRDVWHMVSMMRPHARGSVRFERLLINR